jgi:7-cyano-7-deazaguanine synthase in queuosine biosynthesis
MRRYAVQVDGAPCSVTTGATALSVLPNASNPNTELGIDDVVNAVGRPLTPREDDFIDLLHAIHITDLICARGKNEDWTRDISLSLPLRDPTAFQPLIPLVQEIFGLMTFDHLQIELTAYNNVPPQRFPRKAREAVLRPDAVALLSGGIDSACAAAQLCKDHSHPLFLSARSSPHVSGAQDRVVRALQKNCPTLATAHFRSQPKHRHPAAPLPASDLSQRSRTLLYVGIAGLLASAHSLEEVILGENGIMAINCPLTLGRAAGFSTRTAYPDVLDRMEVLLCGVFRQRIRVVNPLLLETKADVVRRLVRLCGKDVVRDTHSCWIARQADHCGHCVPCVVRRFATESAGVSDVAYASDAFASPGGLSDDAFASVGDYLLFLKRLRSSSDSDLLIDYPDLNIGADAASVQQLLALHRKWGVQVERVVNRYPRLRALY